MSARKIKVSGLLLAVLVTEGFDAMDPEPPLPRDVRFVDARSAGDLGVFEILVESAGWFEPPNAGDKWDVRVLEVNFKRRSDVWIVAHTSEQAATSIIGVFTTPSAAALACHCDRDFYVPVPLNSAVSLQNLEHRPEACWPRRALA